MKSAFKPVVAAVLIATASFATMAQHHPMGEGGMKGHGRMGQMDPAKMQAMMDKRQADLKVKLKVTPAQEGAWTAFTSAMKPPADMAKTHEAHRAEMAKLSTPERIDKMKALRTTRDAEMDKRADAVKAFYAQLSSEQKAVFDALHADGPHGGKGGGHHGGKGGQHGQHG
jgi:periplasmic protein CpxP/Spy